jgi:hypothetical protein
MADQDYMPEEQEQIEPYKQQIEQMGWPLIRTEALDDAEENADIGMPNEISLGLQRELLPSDKALPDALIDQHHPDFPGSWDLVPPEDNLWLEALAEVAGDHLLLELPKDTHESGEPNARPRSGSNAGIPIGWPVPIRATSTAPAATTRARSCAPLPPVMENVQLHGLRQERNDHAHQRAGMGFHLLLL